MSHDWENSVRMRPHRTQSDNVKCRKCGESANIFQTIFKEL